MIDVEGTGRLIGGACVRVCVCVCERACGKAY